MAQTVFGFGNRGVAEALNRFARRNLTQQLPSAIVTQPDLIKPSTRIWMATARTEITAAVGGDLDGDGFNVGSGTAYLLYRWTDTNVPPEFRLKPFMESNRRIWRTVYNANTTAIPVNSSVVFPIIQDRRGHYWVYQTPVVGGNHVAYTENVIPGRTVMMAGGPIEVQPLKLDDSDPPELVADGDPVEVYSWVKSNSSDPADEDDGKLIIFYETDAHGVNWFTGQDCPPAGT